MHSCLRLTWPHTGQYLVGAQHAAEDVDHVGGDGDNEAVVPVAIGINQELRAEPTSLQLNRPAQQAS
jgi:hypothetical protein